MRPILPAALPCALVLAIATSGCSLLPHRDRSDGERPVAVRCDATRVQWAVGEPANADLLAQLRRQAQAGVVQSLAPGQAGEAVADANRLNVAHDGSTITRLHCG